MSNQSTVTLTVSEYDSFRNAIEALQAIRNDNKHIVMGNWSQWHVFTKDEAIIRLCTVIDKQTESIQELNKELEDLKVIKKKNKYFLGFWQ